MSERNLELLTFPADYPIKVVCRRQPGLRGVLDGLVRKHVPGLEDRQVQERDSRAGNFVSITYDIKAQSADHITGLIVELRSHEWVVMVI